MIQVLVTGGTGFIGSHAVIELLKVGYNVVIVDNLHNSTNSVLDRIRSIANVSAHFPGLVFYEVDILDYEKLDHVFDLEPKIEAVIHFAGLKAVAESVKDPLSYYRVNLSGTLNLLKILETREIYNFLFSSSAAVYGEPDHVPITEKSDLNPKNPYARTKSMIERFLKDTYHSAPERWHIISLRYFNPCGAHVSGLIGEDPSGIPQNLMPYVAKVADGELPFLTVFGNDYPTSDGTAIRDYIHVVDLAVGHVKAMKLLLMGPIFEVYNLGTGVGTSVLEMVAAYEESSGTHVRYKFGPRREGDISVLVADPTKARKELDWKATRNIRDMCCDMSNWRKKCRGASKQWRI